MGHALPVYHKRRQYFRVSMGLGVNIEHKINQRSFQSGAGAEVKRKAGSSNFGRAFKIQDAKRCADVPVWLGFKIKNRRITNRFNNRVIGFILAQRHRRMGDVRQTQ